MFSVPRLLVSSSLLHVQGKKTDRVPVVIWLTVSNFTPFFRSTELTLCNLQGELCLLVCRSAPLISGKEAEFTALASEYFRESADDAGAFRYELNLPFAVPFRFCVFRIVIGFFLF